MTDENHIPCNWMGCSGAADRFIVYRDEAWALCQHCMDLWDRVWGRFYVKIPRDEFVVWDTMQS